MELVLDAPASSHRGGDALFGRGRARQVVADLATHPLRRARRGDADRADGLHRHHAAQPRPGGCEVGGPGQLGCVGHEHPAAHEPAMPIVPGVRAGPPPATDREGARIEPVPHRGVQAASVALERDRVVGAAPRDRLGRGRMAGGGVEADERAAQVEPGQQVRQHGGLAALVGNAALRQDQAASRREGADEMQRRPAPPAVEGSAQRLAIDGDLRGRAVVLAVLVARDDERPPRPSEEALLELSGVDQHQHAAERVVRRDAPRQLQEAPEPGPLGAAVERDVLEALGVGQHRAHRDRQHVHQPVLDLRRRARVRHASQALQKLQQHDVLRADAPGDRTARRLRIGLLTPSRPSCVSPGGAPRVRPGAGPPWGRAPRTARASGSPRRPRRGWPRRRLRPRRSRSLP